MHPEALGHTRCALIAATLRRPQWRLNGRARIIAAVERRDGRRGGPGYYGRHGRRVPGGHGRRWRDERSEPSLRAQFPTQSPAQRPLSVAHCGL